MTPPAPVILSVQQVRQEIRRAMEGEEPASAAAPSTLLLGRLFHETFAQWMGGGDAVHWSTALEEHEIGRPDVLLRRVFEGLLAPKLTAHRSLLREDGEQVLALWEASGEMCEWLSRLLAQAAAAGAIRYDRKAQRWTGAADLCAVEQYLTWDLSDPQWRAPVRLTGVADAVFRNPLSGNWCVVDYKLGRALPEADLAQACLYHGMLAASGFDTPGAMAVVSFRPKREEIFFEQSRLAEAQERLRALIGRLAGVSGQVRAAPPRSSPSPAPYKDLADRMVRVLGEYGVSVRIDEPPVVGPSIVRFRLVPGRGVRVGAITGKAEELQVRLEMKSTPAIHNEAGRLVVDIERETPSTVTFASVRNQLDRRGPAGSTRVPLGVDLAGELHFADLSPRGNTPHLLVAGTTGSGKSEWLRTAVAGMIATNTPETLRLAVIDPKQTAFAELRGSPYLAHRDALVAAYEDAVFLLHGLIEEMEERYRILGEHARGDLVELAEHGGPRWPRIVCICDEYGDLVADTARKKAVQPLVVRLGQKARAAGIHLILATQYPNARIVDTTVKSQLPGRVCMRVTKSVESNVILGYSGAEHLLGRGDLYFLDVGEPRRLQAVYLPAEERAALFRAQAPVTAAG